MQSRRRQYTNAGLKPLCLHHVTSLQYTNLLKLLIQHITPLNHTIPKVSGIVWFNVPLDTF